MKKTRVAIVGYGGMGDFHAKRISGWQGSDMDKDFELAGVCDIDPERIKWARINGFGVYDTIEDIYADDTVDIVTVAIPNDQHKDVCIALMDHGKNVICEKPVALNSAELEAMIDAAKRNHVHFSTHQNRRWDEDYQTIKKIYDTNQVGDIFTIETRVHGSRGIPGDWRNEKIHGGGMIYDWGVHLIDQMFDMVKVPVKSLYCVTTNVTNGECDDGFEVIVLFENGLQYHLEVGTSNFISMPRWYLLGVNGSAIIKGWAPDDGCVTMVTDWEKKDAKPVVTAAGLTKTMAPRTEDSIQEYPLDVVHCDVSDYYRNFAMACRGESEQIVKWDEMRRVIKFMEACFESAAENKLITDFEERAKR